MSNCILTEVLKWQILYPVKWFVRFMSYFEEQMDRYTVRKRLVDNVEHWTKNIHVKTSTICCVQFKRCSWNLISIQNFFVANALNKNTEDMKRKHQILGGEGWTEVINQKTVEKEYVSSTNRLLICTSNVSFTCMKTIVKSPNAFKMSIIWLNFDYINVNFFQRPITLNLERRSAVYIAIITKCCI